MGRGGGGGYGGVSHASNFGSIACSRFFTLCTSNLLDQMGFSQMYISQYRGLHTKHGFSLDWHLLPYMIVSSFVVNMFFSLGTVHK